nr:hypothetical protein [Bacteroidota bacterium]
MNALDKNFIKELKSAILQSRYNAARMVNTELIENEIVRNINAGNDSNY